MQVDAIGSQLGAEQANINSANSLGQEEFLRLFLTELNFQDPLEPLDNREFLAQIADFSSLEQARQTGENLENLIFLNSTSQAMNLLGKQVQIQGAQDRFGEVTAVNFSENGPLLTLRTSGDNFVRDIRLSQIELVIQ